ncbi:hypothetical protein PIROE2DRAFT_13114 [Piromyces sp. E2]|nr:hypothetical protein PIROE2DRAFT_13114 [Piromyces sp. E2]|eukprot:OUM60998.1 hypothetical protein PIROE2DRAFT_13114 [Piromyces sp. E2]
MIFLIATHLFIITILSITNSVKSIKAIDRKGQEYVDCEYHRSSISFVNITTIIIESLIAYAIRKIDKKFKEPLSIPVYFYVIYIILYYVMKLVKDNILIYYFSAIGTLMYSSVVLVFLFVIKFYNIYSNKDIENKKIKRLTVVRNSYDMICNKFTQSVEIMEVKN